VDILLKNRGFADLNLSSMSSNPLTMIRCPIKKMSEGIKRVLRKMGGVSNPPVQPCPQVNTEPSGCPHAGTGAAFPVTTEYGKPPYDYADPYPFYDWLLQKGGAVFSPGENTWLIARYDEVTAALKDPRLSKQTGNPNPSPIDFSMLFRDEPDHSRLRGTLAPAFTPGVVATMESSILAIVEDLMGRIEFGRGVDLISQFAMPLPVRVISEILSVPSKDRAQLGEWSAATVPPTGEDGSPLAEGQLALGSAVMGLKTYFAEHFRSGAAALCPHLAKTAPAFQEGPSLSGDELVGSSVLLMIAGHETTVNLIGNGLLCLLRNPEQMEKLRGNPDLIDSAVEEMLRFESPVARGTFRVTAEDVEFSGTVIPRGSFVAPLIGAANRDPRVFPNPNAFYIERRGNKHLAFGNGSHYCLGAQLARLEARVVFKYLLKRFTDIQLADPMAIGSLARLDWIGSTAVRGLRSLPVFLKE
jgi:cytochrome P450